MAIDSRQKRASALTVASNAWNTGGPWSADNAFAAADRAHIGFSYSGLDHAGDAPVAGNKTLPIMGA